MDAPLVICTNKKRAAWSDLFILCSEGVPGAIISQNSMEKVFCFKKGRSSHQEEAGHSSTSMAADDAHPCYFAHNVDALQKLSPVGFPESSPTRTMIHF